MLQIRSKDWSFLTSSDGVERSASQERRSSGADLEAESLGLLSGKSEDAISGEDSEKAIYSAVPPPDSGSMLSYFILDENHIRKLFQVDVTLPLPTFTGFIVAHKSE
jgi:hypothetical protein